MSRRPLSSTLSPVESMNSTPVMSSTTAVLPLSIASVRCSAKRGAVVTWISPRTQMTWAPSSELSSESSKWGTTGDTRATISP